MNIVRLVMPGSAISLTYLYNALQLIWWRIEDLLDSWTG